MPLLVGALVAPPPPSAVKAVQVRDAARSRWIDPTGTEWPLTQFEAGWFTLDAVSGLGAAPITMATDAAPRGGASVRHIQAQPRIVTWPLHIWGDTHTQFVQRYRQLARAFTMTRRLGPGLLVISRPDGTEREIPAYYEAGLDGSRGHLDEDVALSLYCPDPYWRDRTAITEVRAYATIGSFQSPYPTVSSSQVLGETTLDNVGDVEAWPEWRITGPATLMTMTNHATGESWTLNPSAAGVPGGGALTGGQTIVVTTEPPAVRGPAGQVWTAALDWPGAVLWGLVEGENPVAFNVTGAGPGTRVEMLYRPRYETA